jgi:hypothetical protein
VVVANGVKVTKGYIINSIQEQTELADKETERGYE